jgi:putative hydrolase of HD superfamily
MKLSLFTSPRIFLSSRMKQQITSIVEVLKLAERLKFELRHSYTSSGRQESVAEHTWRMSLMAVLIEPLLKTKVDTARLLKMIVIHDLVEAEAKDISALDVLRNPEIKSEKSKKEQQAIENLREALINTNGEEIYNLFYEFENKETYEAKVANALDKLEVQLQHNHADFSTWEEIEYDMCYMMDKHVLFDETLMELKNQIEEEAERKMKHFGIDTDKVKLRVIK